MIVTSEKLKNLFLNITTNVFKITNGFDYINKEVNLDKKFSISHVGSLYPERNPKFLWDVLEELFDGSLFSDLQINFIGNTSEKIKKEFNLIPQLWESALKDCLKKIKWTKNQF